MKSNESAGMKAKESGCFKQPVAVAIAVFVAMVAFSGRSDAAPSYKPLGQPNLKGTSLATRCENAKARFSFLNNGGFKMYGPSGIAIDPRGRIFVTDYGGRRVLTWPNFEALQACTPADAVIGAGDLAGPESVAFDVKTNSLFVADTLSHTVRGYHRNGANWTKFVTLGKVGTSGPGFNRFNFPRGLAFDSGGRLFVADDSNNRVLIFNPPFVNGASSVDFFSAANNGGLSGPKALAIVGSTLFVADYNNQRVLRFTGPFLTPDQTYTASGIFTGVSNPVDLAAHPDGSLLVTDQQNPHIARYDDAAFAPSGTPSSTFSENMGTEPLGVAADRNGRIYIADYRHYRLLVRNESVKKTPITANSTSTAKTLLAQFNVRGNRATDRVAVGQQLITYLYGPKSNPNAWYGDWLQLTKGKFPLPEIMGGETSDLMSYAGFSPNQDALNELIRHGKAGHIVTLVWHPENPVNKDQFSRPVTTAQLAQVRDDNTAIGKRWQAQLNRAAAVLKKFKDAGVPVVFRPLHEQNGNFFWWGDNGAAGAALRSRQAAWVAMWRDMVAELTVRKGLNNLLFVFGTNQVNFDGVVPPLTYYPGAESADLVSIDLYDEQLDMAGGERGLQHYAALIGTGKPFGLSEFGQSFNNNGTGATGGAWDARTLTSRIRDSYPRTAFATAWYSSKEGGKPFVFALPDVSNAKQMLDDALIDTQ